jgi:hypothetical protein
MIRLESAQLISLLVCRAAMFEDLLQTISLPPGALTDSPNTKIPTVTDNLFSQGTIRANEIGISFEPTSGREIMNGEITWGRFREIMMKWILTNIPIRWYRQFQVHRDDQLRVSGFLPA